jgi:phosphoribosylamine--glycine ligase
VSSWRHAAIRPGGNWSNDRGLDRAAQRDRTTIFHSATARGAAGEWLTAGGRVLGVTATGENLDLALSRCYGAIERHSLGRNALPADIGRPVGAGASAKG